MRKTLPVPAVRKLFPLLLGFLLLSATAGAQTTIKGSVRDTAQKKNLPLSVVMLLKRADSTLYRHTRANENGQFSFTGVQPGKYVLFISCPKFVDYTDTFTLAGEPTLNAGEVALTPKAKILEMAVVKQKIAAMRWKGDTLVVKADSIKVAEDATVEDLLKRIPGFQVDKNGNITAMGEKVQKVLVDGEEFFGDDPTIATRNLDARAVNEVELFDKKSDQAVFSGVDDGSKTKTINLKLKEDRKKGYFGKLQAGSNGKELWDNNAMLNAFRGKRKISLYGIMSKTGKTGLDWGERMNYGGSGGMETVSDGDGSFFINIEDTDDEMGGWDGRFEGSGVPKSWSVGVNYNNKWNDDKQSLSGSYKYGKINTPSGSSVRSQYILPDTLYYINSENSGFNSSASQKINLYSTLKIDSASTFKITAIGGRTTNISRSKTYKESLNEERGFVNTNRTENNNAGTANSLTATLFYSHNFKKLRRNFSATASLNNRQQESSGFLYSTTDFYSGGIPASRDTIDQQRKNNSEKMNGYAKIAWSEPLSKTATAQVSYQAGSNNNHSTRNVYDKLNGKYESLNPLNSVDFRVNEFAHTIDLGYSQKLKKLFINAGNSFIFTRQNRKDLKGNSTRSFNFTNINPRLNIRLNPNKYTNFNMFVSGNTNQPSADQLQPVQDNSDRLNIIVGNPLLKPSFRANTYIWFNRYYNETENSINLSASAGNTWNAITGQESFDNLGRRTTQYINQPGGNYFYSLRGGYDHKIKGTPFRANVSGNYTINANTNYVNGLKNQNRARTFKVEPEVQIEWEEKLWGNIGTELGWTSSVSDINTAARPKYRTNRSYVDVSYNVPKKFSIGTDINYNFREKISPTDANNEVTAWNAYVTWKLGKAKTWNLGFYLYDILNQNNGFNRNVTATGITESENIVLRRYWLLKLTWKFAKNGKPAWE